MIYTSENKRRFIRGKTMSMLLSVRGAICASLVGMIFTGPSNTSFAFELDADEIRGKSSKTPVTVLQNRAFLKTFRPETGFIVGTVLDEAYLDTAIVGVRTGMFINEWLGFEVQMVKASVADSTDREALNQIRYKVDEGDSADAIPDDTDEDVYVTVDPEVNAVRGMTDISVLAAPFYGKLNFMNKFIIHTDIYGSAGLSKVETDQGDKTALTFGVGERFYLGKAWSVRMDFRDRIFSETRAGIENKKNSMTVDVGASYFFN
jgi:outer membrane beta-barrel protein